MVNSNIEKLADLSKIIITKEESREFKEKLDNVMSMIDIMKEVDCSSVDPLTSVSSMKLRTRPDQVTETSSASSILSNVPGKSKPIAQDLHYFIVPKVID